MATISKFEDLEIWQLSRLLTKKIHDISGNGALKKDFSLRDQMNRSAGSIMDNIAEGFGRSGRVEFIQFLSYAAGSADELKSQLYRCLDKGYLYEQEFDDLMKRLLLFIKKYRGLLNTLITRF